MAGHGDPGLVYACLTHVPLWLEFPSYVTTIHLGQSQQEGRLNLRDLAPQWEPHHPLLGGAAGAFALKNYLLKNRPDATRVGICQYRKFVSRERISRVVAKSYAAMDVVQQSALPQDRLAQLMDPGAEPFLVSRLLSLRKEGGYLRQYGRAHHAEDLLRFTAEAVAQGVLDAPGARSFLNETQFIPGGIELGVFPAEFWLRHIGEVEAVVRACIERYPVARADYQARAWAFCGERLGSYLLLRHFRGLAGTGGEALARWFAPSHWTRRFVGHLNLITRNDESDYAIGGA